MTQKYEDTEDTYAEAFKAMKRLARAQKRGTGCHLTAEMVRNLAITDFGQLWADPKLTF